MALGTVHEDSDGREDIPKIHFPAGEDRAGRDRELRAARLALEDAAGLEGVALATATLAAHRIAVRVSPADRTEQVERLVIAQAHDLRQREGAGGGGKEEMLAGGFHL